jgi:hypothetical protein
MAIEERFESFEDRITAARRRRLLQDPDAKIVTRARVPGLTQSTGESYQETAWPPVAGPM